MWSGFIKNNKKKTLLQKEKDNNKYDFSSRSFHNMAVISHEVETISLQLGVI